MLDTSKFTNVVVKLSGDSFEANPIKEPTRVAEDLQIIRNRITGTMVVCVGGGETHRAEHHNSYGESRRKNDMEGMIDSAINASALIGVLGDHSVGLSGVSRKALSEAADKRGRHDPLHFAIGSFAYDWQSELLDNIDELGKKIIVVGGGIGHVLTTGDLSAGLWAAALSEPSKPTAFIKGIHDDYLYLSDRTTNPNSKPVMEISYATARDLDVPILDPTAWPLLESANVTVLLANEDRLLALSGALQGLEGTWVYND